MKSSDLRSGSDWAKPGVKCVYVGPRCGGLDEWGQAIPRRREVCTVRSVHSDGDAIRLVEIVNEARLHSTDSGGIALTEQWFFLTVFRPLVTNTLEQDTEMFKELLNTLPADLDPLEEVVDYAGLMLDASYAVRLAAHTRGGKEEK